MVKKGAIFLDRDGVLNIPIIENRKTYAPLKTKDFKLYPYVKILCKKLKKYFLLIVITNQPDLKRNKLKYSDFNLMNKKLKKEINYDELYFCDAISNSSKYRKPNTGMLEKAIIQFNIDVKKSFLIGDRKSDILAADRIRCKSIFIDRNYKEKKPITQIKTVKSFKEAANSILNI